MVLRYILTTAISLISGLCLFGLLGVFFAGVSQTKTTVEFYYYLVFYSVGSLLLISSAVLYWKRKRAALILFGSWTLFLLLSSLFLEFVWQDILTFMLVSLITLVLMVRDLRRVAI